MKLYRPAESVTAKLIWRLASIINRWNKRANIIFPKSHQIRTNIFLVWMLELHYIPRNMIRNNQTICGLLVLQSPVRCHLIHRIITWNSRNQSKPWSKGHQKEWKSYYHYLTCTFLARIKRRLSCTCFFMSYQVTYQILPFAEWM